MFKAREYNFDVVNNIMNTYAEPTFQNMKNTVDSLGNPKQTTHLDYML